MSKIKNTGLDQYGAEPFEKQQFGKAGIEGIKDTVELNLIHPLCTIVDLSVSNKTYVNILASPVYLYCIIVDMIAWYGYGCAGSALDPFLLITVTM